MTSEIKSRSWDKRKKEEICAEAWCHHENERIQEGVYEDRFPTSCADGSGARESSGFYSLGHGSNTKRSVWREGVQLRLRHLTIPRSVTGPRLRLGVRVEPHDLRSVLQTPTVQVAGGGGCVGTTRVLGLLALSIIQSSKRRSPSLPCEGRSLDGGGQPPPPASRAPWRTWQQHSCEAPGKSKRADAPRVAARTIPTMAGAARLLTARRRKFCPASVRLAFSR